MAWQAGHGHAGQAQVVTWINVSGVSRVAEQAMPVCFEQSLLMTYCFITL